MRPHSPVLNQNIIKNNFNDLTQPLPPPNPSINNAAGLTMRANALNHAGVIEDGLAVSAVGAGNIGGFLSDGETQVNQTRS